ncbi:MAG TPA: hypothetical protein PKZ34_04795, partial [Thermotogota bacterium]|nr:hypothetical protein [Thermotogota bacterium]
GAIHKNQAARRKSRVTKKVNALLAKERWERTTLDEKRPNGSAFFVLDLIPWYASTAGYRGV